MQHATEGLRPKPAITKESLWNSATSNQELMACMRSTTKVEYQQAVLAAWLCTLYPKASAQVQSFVQEDMLTAMISRGLLMPVQEPSVWDPPPRPAPRPRPVPAADPVVRKYRAWTDGSCLQNPGGPGAAAALIYADDGTKQELKQGYRSTTNNRMELRAVIMVLEALPAGAHVHVVSDSDITVGKLDRNKLEDLRARGWKRSKKAITGNHDLWEHVLTLLQVKDIVVSAEWTRAHLAPSDAGYDANNDYVDKLANATVSSKKDRIEDVGYETLVTPTQRRAELSVVPTPPDLGAAIDKVIPNSCAVGKEQIDRAVCLAGRLSWPNGSTAAEHVRRELVLEHLRQRRHKEKHNQKPPAHPHIERLTEDEALDICASFRDPTQAARDIEGWVSAVMCVCQLRPQADAYQIEYIVATSVERALGRIPPTTDMLGAAVCRHVVACFRDPKQRTESETNTAMAVIRERLDKLYPSDSRPKRQERVRLLEEIIERFTKTLA